MNKFIKTYASKTIMRIMLIASIMVQTSCSQDEAPAETGGLLTLSARMDVPATRATIGNTWDGTETVKVQLSNGGALDGTYDFNVDNTGKLTQTGIYWESASQSVTAVAWYPDKTAYMSAADFSDQSDLQKLDFIFATSVNGITPGNWNSEEKKLAFNHKTAKVKAALKAGNGITSLSGVKVSFFGYKTVQAIDPSTGTLSGGGSNDWLQANHGASDTLALLVL